MPRKIQNTLKSPIVKTIVNRTHGTKMGANGKKILMGHKQVREANKSEVKWYQNSEIYKQTGCIDPAKMHALLEQGAAAYFGRQVSE